MTPAWFCPCLIFQGTIVIKHFDLLPFSVYFNLLGNIKPKSDHATAMPQLYIALYSVLRTPTRPRNAHTVRQAGIVVFLVRGHTVQYTDAVT